MDEWDELVSVIIGVIMGAILITSFSFSLASSSELSQEAVSRSNDEVTNVEYYKVGTKISYNEAILLIQQPGDINFCSRALQSDANRFLSLSELISYYETAKDVDRTVNNLKLVMQSRNMFISDKLRIAYSLQTGIEGSNNCYYLASKSDM